MQLVQEEWRKEPTQLLAKIRKACGNGKKINFMNEGKVLIPNICDYKSLLGGDSGFANETPAECSNACFKKYPGK